MPSSSAGALAPERGTERAWIVGMIVTVGEVWVTGDGMSMSPTVRDGDRVLLRAVASIRRGQVVLAECGVGFVLHRVRRVRADGLLETIGDSQSESETVAPARVLARATLVERAGTRERVALEPTLRHGVPALARGLYYRSRLALARVWRLRLRFLTVRPHP